MWTIVAVNADDLNFGVVVNRLLSIESLRMTFYGVKNLDFVILRDAALIR